MASTCFSHLYRFFVSQQSQWAGGFATILSQSRWFNNSPIKSARTLTTSQLPLESVREETSLQLRQRVRTLRSLVFFWQNFNEANCHPRHAAVGLLVQSKPWRPQQIIFVNISSFCENSNYFQPYFITFSMNFSLSVKSFSVFALKTGNFRCILPDVFIYTENWRFFFGSTICIPKWFFLFQSAKTLIQRTGKYVWKKRWKKNLYFVMLYLWLMLQWSVFLL